eukprot:c3915_g1_i1.p1 GENE.c3915_g1_i1~~c3915_g1_i1.p1  ORF type:complete len:166 (+),score=33.24 c3915_g1_i1:217-714(+)
MDRASKSHVVALKRAIKHHTENSEEDKEALQKIETQHKECLKLCKEKIDLANRAYDVIDNHIRRLDDYLSRFENELRETGGAESQKDNQTKEDDSKDVDMPIDPNEPTYCICHRVSFGEMVACDNPECKVEWFHFECVGLKKQPKGRWFCPECTENNNKKRQKKM